MTYWRLYYHVVWTTKRREPMIIPEIEEALYRAIAHKAIEIKTSLFAINGMPDHVHVVAAIPPTVGLPHFAQMLKGSSSRFVHLEYKIPFDWQEGYGIFTVSQRNLRRAIEYVQRQKEHHEAQTTVPELERSSEEDDGPRLMFKSPY